MNRAGAGLAAAAALVALTGCAVSVAAKSVPADSPAASRSPDDVTSNAVPAPRPSASKVPASWWPKRTGNVVYLTFDDGPWPTTPEVLDVLRDNGAFATFFQVGSMVDDYGSVNRRIIAEGHAIGNHTYDHVYMNKLSDDLVRYQLEKAWRTIGYDVQGPCVRPPFGAAGPNQRRIAVDKGLTPVFWTIDTRDWASPPEDSIYKQIVGAKPGSIVLMHDGGGDRTKTIAALRRALPVLKKRGYVFKTVPVCVRR